jgi:DNA-directed RNA polymerase specialized sigma24 family protein
MSPRNFFAELKRRYFGGLTVEETAEFLKLSQRTVEREWTAAKAWPYRELSGEET